MVAVLVQLKWQILRNGFKRSVWQVVALCFALCYGAILVISAIAGLIWLSTQDVEGIRSALQLLGAVTILGWWIVPLIAFGVDATMDPNRLAMFPIPQRKLLPGLVIAGLLGVPGIMTVVLFAGTLIAWIRHPIGILPMLVMAVVAMALCIVGSRAFTTAMGPVIAGRKFREVAIGLVTVPLLLVGPIMSVVGSSLRSNRDAIPTYAEFIAWTPVGAPFAVAGDVVEGRYWAALARVGISLAALALLTWLWSRSLMTALENVGRGAHTKIRRAGLGPFGWLPASPVGAIAARGFIYRVRDPRYAMNLLMVPLMPVLFYFVGQSAENETQSGGLILLSGPLCAFLLGWITASDVSLDGTALWSHVAAPITGKAERWGRAIPSLAVGVPSTVIIVLVGMWLTDSWRLFVPLLGLSLGILLTSVAVSLVLSSTITWPTQKAGQNPFATPQGGTLASFLAQIVGWFALLILCVPAVVMYVVAVVDHNPWLGFAVFVVGLGSGVGYLLAGVHWGGKIYDRRAPELLQSTLSFR